jgi:gluconokinase
MPPPFILTLDIGTSSTRAMLFDAAARSLDGYGVRLPYRVQTTPDGGAEFDADELFAAVVKVIDQLLAQAGPLANDIGAVAIDTMVTNIFGLNHAGRPVTPVLTYADTRAAGDAAQLRAEFGPDGVAQVHNRTGCVIHASYLPPRFRWMASARPDWLKQAARWASVGEYLVYRFFGRWQASYSGASWTGLLNRHTLTWDDDWLAHLPLSAEQLSPLGDVDQPLSGLQSEWADRWPALKNIPWFPAIGDGAAANIGSGACDPSRLALTLGTSGAMRAVLPAGGVATVPDGLWLYRVDAQRGLLGGATTEGGNLYAWFQDTLRLPPVEQLEAELAQLPPAAHGLSLLPFIAGERAPGWHDEARASLINFTLNTRPLDIVKAGLESIAFRFALIYRRVTEHLPAHANRQIVAGGGLLNSPAWLQIFADALGRPVIALAEKEATSRGAALLALEALGVIDSVAALPPTFGKTYQPNAEHHHTYQAAMAAQQEYYARLIG